MYTNSIPTANASAINSKLKRPLKILVVELETQIVITDYFDKTNRLNVIFQGVQFGYPWT